jgi:hypothetical protein
MLFGLTDQGAELLIRRRRDGYQVICYRCKQVLARHQLIRDAAVEAAKAAGHVCPPPAQIREIPY